MALSGKYLLVIYLLDNVAAEINALDAANAYRFGFQAIQSLIKKAEVTDNRIRFY